jgi:DNA modification methylase
MTPNQMILPLLEVIQDQGGKTTPSQAYRTLAEKLEVSREKQEETLKISSGRSFNRWERDVRLTRQLAVFKGLIPQAQTPAERGIWSLTPQGESLLGNAKPGSVVTLFVNENNVVLWAEAEAAVKLIEDDLVQAIITSPPYPILRKKPYEGQLDEEEHVRWLAAFFTQAKRVLTPDGSLALNLGPAWKRGTPTQSLYAEKLVLQLCEQAGYHLAQKLYWHNPAKLPAPAEWVTVRRVRITPAVEEIFWLSKSPHPKASNRNVLKEYSASMLGRLRQGGESKSRVKPSGHRLQAGAFSRDNGGAIPHNLLQIANSRSQDPYLAHCRKIGHPAHPARFPVELVEFLVKLLSEPGDLLWDPFAGSLTTAEAATKLGRLCITSELNGSYAQDGIDARLLQPT